MIGKTFGRLTIICESGKRTKSGNKFYWTHCSCGNLKIALGSYLKNGKLKSCGCLRKEKTKSRNIARTKHGMAWTRIYHIWKAMRRRCEKPKCKFYKHYGRRGIKVCEKWHDFVAFKTWAYVNGYRDDLTIDRIDNDGNYTPGNCQWLTREDNTRKGGR